MTKHFAVVYFIIRSFKSLVAPRAAASLLFAFLFTGAEGASAETISKWQPWFELGGYYNNRKDDAAGSFGTSRGETSIFVPLRGGERSLLFGQITAEFFDGDAQ